MTSLSPLIISLALVGLLGPLPTGSKVTTLASLPFFRAGKLCPTQHWVHLMLSLNYSHPTSCADQLDDQWNQVYRGMGAYPELSPLVDAIDSKSRHAAEAAAGLSWDIIGPGPRRLVKRAISYTLDIGSAISALFTGIGNLINGSQMRELQEKFGHLTHRLDGLSTEFHALTSHLSTVSGAVNHLSGAVSYVAAGLHLEAAFDYVSGCISRASAGIQLLASGQLSTDILSLFEAKLAFQQLEAMARGYGLQVAVADALHLFSTPFSYFLNSTHLVAMLHVPAFAPEDCLTLWELSPLPIVASPEGGYLRIEAEHQWLAISEGLPADRKAALFSDSDFQRQCSESSHNTWTCDEPVIRTDLASSCLATLFLTGELLPSCKVSPAVRSDFAYTASGGLIAFFPNTTDLALMCPQGDSSYFTSPPGLVSISVPMGCSLHADDWVVPATLSSPLQPLTEHTYSVDVTFGSLLVPAVSPVSAPVVPDFSSNITMHMPNPGPATQTHNVAIAAISLAAAAISLLIGACGFLLYRSRHPAGATAPPTGEAPPS